MTVTSSDLVGRQQRTPPRDVDARVVPRRTNRDASVRCQWCGRRLPDQGGVGRRRRYCAQSCRQRAYESRHTLRRGSVPGSPVDAVVLTVEERDDLADRLYQVQCAAEDVATALTESAGRAELIGLVETLLVAARAADRIR
jgi:hypothetical protein